MAAPLPSLFYKALTMSSQTEKLLTLALDPRTNDNEAQMAFKNLRKNTNALSYLRNDAKSNEGPNKFLVFIHYKSEGSNGFQTKAIESTSELKALEILFNQLKNKHKGLVLVSSSVTRVTKHDQEKTYRVFMSYEDDNTIGHSIKNFKKTGNLNAFVESFDEIMKDCPNALITNLNIWLRE